jgi:DNA polymerase III epsilon subunit-like protein
MHITALDTETTGLDLKRHQIIQLGIIQYEYKDNGDLRLLEKFQYNIKPSNINAASPEALKINGYTEEQWIDAEPFIVCFPLLDYVFKSSDALIGQNLIFDLRFIKK